MSARTVEELSRTIREDLGSRRKEIQTYAGYLKRAEPGNKAAILRGAVAVLYAHWEGFVKSSLQEYVSFVRMRRKNMNELNDPFVAMAARKYLTALGDSRRARIQIEFVRWFQDNWERRAHIPKSSIIDAQSNLSPEVLRELFAKVGLEYGAEYAVAEKPVIERLVELRNRLAHGEWRMVEEREWQEQLYPKITELLALLCDQIENAAITGMYRRPQSSVALAAG